MITIITRTSSRPELLQRLITSVMAQNCKEIKHLILADNQKAVNYTEKICQRLKYKAQVVKVRKESDNNGFYNLYLNTGISLVTSGWIALIDDDDYIFSQGLKRILPLLKDEKRIYICQYLRGQKVKPMTGLFSKINYHAGDNARILCGTIGGGCLIFQQKHAAGILWDDKRCADFRFIKRMTAKNDYTFIPIVLQKATATGNKGKNIYS